MSSRSRNIFVFTETKRIFLKTLIALDKTSLQFHKILSTEEQKLLRYFKQFSANSEIYYSENDVVLLNKIRAAYIEYKKYLKY